MTSKGSEAGGHGSSQALAVNHLLLSVLKDLPSPRPVIVAAGGIATGAQLASTLTLGADGAAIGTRFLMTKESGYSSAKKDALVKAGLYSTARSRAFDEMNGTVGWPEWTDGRALAGEIVNDIREGLDLETRLERARSGGMERTTVWAGQGVGLVDTIQPAEVSVPLGVHGVVTEFAHQDVIRELRDEAVSAIHRSASLISIAD